MSTIESLDLASLTNNPQSIAEALEDVLETSSGNIGSLKTSAQTDHDYIEGLRTSAQADHDAIETLYSNTNAEHYHMATGFSNSFTAYSWRSQTTNDEGVRIRRLGVLYLVDIAVIKSQGTGYFYDLTIMNVGTNITKPTNTVWLGNNSYSYSSSDDVYFTPVLTTSGDLQVSGYSGDSTNNIIYASFSGIDVA